MMNRKPEQIDHLYYITKLTQRYNLDNISRTKAYQNFYKHFPEIKWAFVASMVSRNAGWNMTDLYLPPFQKMLSAKERNRLFMTYERANWLIFSDAYPQLLIYELSTYVNKPMFHFLKKFNVSEFMIKEWQRFWFYNDKNRLLKALIINEQNVIHQPVINHSYFKYHVFFRLPYLLQDFLFVNAVIFPTRTGTIYGQYVHDFTNVTKRITLGKQIASIIFHPKVYEKIYDFAMTTEHTGSRLDYESYLPLSLPSSPMLRTVYPLVSHKDIIRNDWYRYDGLRKDWFSQTTIDYKQMQIGTSFYRKRHLLYAYYHIAKMFSCKNY